jgi:hypothetical protein
MQDFCKIFFTFLQKILIPYNIGKFIFALGVFGGLAFVVCFSYYDIEKIQLCKYLFLLWVSFVFRYFAKVLIHGTPPPNTTTEQAHGNSPCLPCEFLDREFLDVNF